MRELILVFVVNMVVLDFLVVVFLIFCMIIREIIGFNVFFVYGNGGMFFCKMFIFFSDILLLVLI